jgi:hypothetical protein
MSAIDSLYTVLNTDTDLIALLTGGVYAVKDLPANEFNSKNCPDAWDAATGVMRPSIVLRGRASVPQWQIPDMAAQFVDIRQVIEMYLYDDRYAGWGTITDAADRIYELLQWKFISGAGMVSLINQFDDTRAPEYADACMVRVDYAVEAVKAPHGG